MKRATLLVLFAGLAFKTVVLATDSLLGDVATLLAGLALLAAAGWMLCNQRYCAIYSESAPAIRIGAALLLSGPRKTAHSMLGRADAALYAAKTQGRARCVLAAAEESS